MADAVSAGAPALPVVQCSVAAINRNPYSGGNQYTSYDAIHEFNA